MVTNQGNTSVFSQLIHVNEVDMVAVWRELFFRCVILLLA